MSAELCPLPEFWCFGRLRTTLGREWASFPQQMRAHRWGWEWIKHNVLTPCRLDVSVKTRKYSPGEAKWRANEACSKTSESQLGFQLLLSTEVEAGDGQLSIAKYLQLAYTRLLNYWHFSIKTNVMFLHSLLWRYKQYKHTHYTTHLVALSWGGGAQFEYRVYKLTPPL